MQSYNIAKVLYFDEKSPKKRKKKDLDDLTYLFAYV